MLIFNKLNDKQLVNAIKNGNKEALKQLYKDNYMSVRSYILKNSGNNDDIDDVLQDACIAIWEKINNNSLVLNSKLSTFVFAIAKNIWLKKLNKNSRNSPISEYHSEILSETADSFSFADKKIISDLMSQIGSNCKEILTYFYYEGRDMVSIAKLLNYNNADTAKAKKHQCFKRLQELVLQNYNKSDFLDH